MQLFQNELRVLVANPVLKKYQDIYIVGTNKTALEVFSGLISRNIYVKGFVEALEARIVLYNKLVYTIEDIDTFDYRKSLLIIADNKYCMLQSRCTICKNPFLVNDLLENKEIIIWGKGDVGQSVYHYLIKHHYNVSCFIDQKKEEKENSVPVYGVEILQNVSKDTVVITAANDCAAMCDYINTNCKEVIYLYQKHKISEMLCIEPFLYYRTFHLLYEIYILLQRIHNRKIYIYGTGSKAVLLKILLEYFDCKVCAFLCSETCYGQLENTDVIPVTDIIYEQNCFVIIESDNTQEAMEQMSILGYEYIKDYLSADNICSHYGNKIRNIILDINLGQSYLKNDKYPGFTVFGKDTAKTKIVILGGSTTDSTLYPFTSWPEYFYKGAEHTVVYNGAVSGYTSAQELVKFLRDVIWMEPDLVIVYDGVNDMFLETDNDFEFSYLKEIVSFANKNTGSKVEISCGLKKIEDYFDNWFSNISMMKCLAENKGIKYCAFLQPSLGSKKNRSAYEEGLWRGTYQYINSQCRKNTTYFRKRMEGLDHHDGWLCDLSGIFDHVENVYMDSCHVTEDGNRMIASEILKHLTLKGII